MYIPLLKNKNRRQINQVMLCSAWFILVSISVFSQQKWVAIDAGTTMSRNIRVIKVDSLENKLVIGGAYVQMVNGVSSCTYYKWSPENGVEILSPNDPNEMAITVAQDVFFKGDSMVAVGGGGLAIRHQNQWVYNLLDGNIGFEEIIPYQNKYLVAYGYNKYLKGNKYGQLLNWDGDTTFSEFENISTFMSSSGSAVVAVIEYNDEIYVAGNASTLGGGIMNEIMRWTGSQWTDVGDGILDATGLGGVNEMVEYKGDLYIGGQFAQENHSKENHIARWNGQEWLSVGGGVENDVRSIYSMHVYNGYLYVGGAFDTIGGIPANGIARWDGKEWCSCNSSFHGAVVMSITHFRDTLYVAGNFNFIDGDTIYKIAKFIGSDFADTCGSSTVGIKTLESEKKQIMGYPNPAEESINFLLDDIENQEVEIRIYNLTGQLIHQQAGYIYANELSLDVSAMSKGMYLGELIINHKKHVFSFIRK